MILEHIPGRRLDHEYRIRRKWREQVMIQNIAGLSRAGILMSELIIELPVKKHKAVPNYELLL